MISKGRRRIAGVTVYDIEGLMTQIREASQHSINPNAANGLLYNMLLEAIRHAKKPGNDGYGSSSTGNVMSMATLGEKNRFLLAAEFYIQHGEYRDKEAFSQ